MTGNVEHVFLRQSWHFKAPEGIADLFSKSIWQFCYTPLLVTVWSLPRVLLSFKKWLIVAKRQEWASKTNQRSTNDLIWSSCSLRAAEPFHRCALECGFKTGAKGTERPFVGNLQYINNSVPKQQADKLFLRSLFFITSVTKDLGLALIGSLFLIVIFPEMENHHRSESQWSGSRLSNPWVEHNTAVVEYVWFVWFMSLW